MSDDTGGGGYKLGAYDEQRNYCPKHFHYAFVHVFLSHFLSLSKISLLIEVIFFTFQSFLNF
jgi:hypothetical protein